MRAFILLVLVLVPLLIACDPGPGPSTGETPDPETPAADTKTPGDRVPMATTGISVIQRDHEALGVDVAAMEKALAEGKALDPRLTRLLPKRWNVLDIAARRALAEYTVQEVRMRRARGLQKRGVMEREYREALEEAASIKEMLAAKKKGIADIPEGFTEAELLDKMADEQLSANAIKVKVDELTDELVAMENLLKQDSIPPQGESLFSREVEDLQGLKKRIDALVGKLG